MISVTGIDEDAADALPLLKQFMRMFSADFDLHFVDAPTRNKSLYAACVLRPRKEVEIMFGLDRPILSIFFLEDHLNFPLAEIIRSEYQNAQNRFGAIDPQYVFVCSTSEKAQGACDFLSMFSEQSFVFVPFIVSTSFASNAVKRNVFERIGIRNYFDNSDAIQTDNFFFGRQRLLTNVLGAVRSSQNIGLFGLRRVGKTSILFSIKRALEQRNLGAFILFSLDDPNRVKSRWYSVLSQILDILESNSIRQPFDDSNAAHLFKASIKRYLDKTSNKGIVIAFDEIEHIVPGTAKAEHWNGDYFFLMDVLRSVSREIDRLSIIVCGINAKALEQSHFLGVPNPIFNGMSVIDVPMFSLDETAHMITRLGLYMGIQFDKAAIDAIQKEYGGHPLLVRQFCSKIFGKLQYEERDWPFDVDKEDVELHIEQLRPQIHYWANYIFYTLKDFYPDEYDMLKVLAQGDVAFYSAMEDSNPEFATHLRGYGLVVGKPPRLSLPFLRQYLVSQETEVLSEIASASAEAYLDPLDGEKAYDYLVISALDEEFSAFMEAAHRYKVRQLRTLSDMPYTLHDVVVSGGRNKTRKRVLICTPDKAGPFSMQNVILHLHFRFDIGYYVLIGLCAGLRGKARIADLIIADQVIDYSQSKTTNNGVETRPLVFPAGALLHNAAKRFKAFKWPSSYSPQEAGQIHIGNVVSGPVVFADDKSLKRLASNWPKLIGAEMEASGILHALHSIGRGDRLLVVKAVSDYGDSKKDDTAREKCCAASAAFALQFIRSRELGEAARG